MKTGKIRAKNGEITLSRMIFGAAVLGSVRTREESFRLLDAYYDAGGRTLETARSSFELVPFGASQSERTIGLWMKARNRAHEMQIVTKGGHPDMRDMRMSRLDRKNLEHDIMTSLAVLGVDKVAGFILHRDDESIPVIEIMDVLDDIVTRGYADFIGASNWTVRRIDEANAYARSKNQAQFTASSIWWSAAKIEAETFARFETMVQMDQTEYAGYLQNHIPVLAYSSQACGYFAKFLAGVPQRDPRAHAMDTEVNQARARRLREVGDHYAVTPGAVCLAYISANRVDGYPIFSASSEAQLAESAQAFDLTITQEDIDYIING